MRQSPFCFVLLLLDCLFVFLPTLSCEWLHCCSSTGLLGPQSREHSWAASWEPGINFDPTAALHPLCPEITGARPRFAEDLQSHKSASTFVQDFSCMPAEHTLQLTVLLISGHLNFPVTIPWLFFLILNKWPQLEKVNFPKKTIKQSYVIKCYKIGLS